MQEAELRFIWERVRAERRQRLQEVAVWLLYGLPAVALAFVYGGYYVR